MHLQESISTTRTLAVAAMSIALSLAVNALVFALGWNESSDTGDPGWAPPGWVVGGIWVVLFGLMGAATQVARSNSIRSALIVLIVACAIYPLYTGGLQSEAVGLVGNVATLMLAAVLLTMSVQRGERVVGLMLVPLVARLIFAAFLTSGSSGWP